MRRAERAARRRQPARRGVLALLAALLALLLVGQVGFHYRDHLAAGWPATRPVLQAGCDVLGCRIEAPRRMWDFTGEFSEAGLPVFDLAGNAVAVLTNQQSAEGADEDGGSHHDVFARPLAPVLKSLEAAQKRVPAALEKAAETKKDADGEKPAPPAAPSVDPAPKEPAPKEPAPKDPAPKDAVPEGAPTPR